MLKNVVYPRLPFFTVGRKVKENFESGPKISSCASFRKQDFFLSI